MSAIFAALADRRAFIVARIADKHPVNPMHADPSSSWANSDAQDSSTWMLPAEALAHVARLGAGFGVGIVLNPSHKIACVDIDGAYDPATGEWTAIALQLLECFAGAYVEISVSGRGLHIIFAYQGDFPAHACKDTARHIELYHERRYILLTGTSARGNPLQDCTDLAHGLVYSHFPATSDDSSVNGEWTDGPVWHVPGTADDVELIRKMRASHSTRAMFNSKASIEQLWTADADALGKFFPPNKHGHAYDASSADMSLANSVIWWTGGDCVRTERIMRQSALLRDKWDHRADYLTDTICDALAFVAKNPPTDRNAPLVVAPPPPAAPAVLLTQEPPVPDATAAAVNQVLLAGQFTKAKSGIIHGTVRNAVVYLQGIPWMSEVFFDEFSRRIFFQGQEWSPQNETPQLLAVQTHVPAISPDTFARAVEAIALSQRRDRLRDWVLTLPQWDGQRRLSRWLTHAFGCPPDRYHMRVGRSWLISMIARALKPGEKVDTMPVLEGIQGKRKSMALDALANPFFLEAPGLKFGDRDFLLALQGAWLIEVPELSALRNADVDSIKATITKRVDRYRAPYARRDQDHPRRFVFAGTVNESSYLRDATGNRRFLPIECNTVNLEWIRAIRDMLFAEALLAYRAGRNWWTFPKLATSEMQDDRLPADPWAALIGRWMAINPGKATINGDDLHTAVGVAAERRTRATESRLGTVMRKSFSKWRRTRLRIPGSGGERDYFYVRPDFPPVPT